MKKYFKVVHICEHCKWEGFPIDNDGIPKCPMCGEEDIIGVKESGLSDDSIEVINYWKHIQGIYNDKALVNIPIIELRILLKCVNT